MTLSEYSIHNLKEIITGDARLTPNLSGRKLVALFNKYGFRGIYNGSLPDNLSRNDFAEKRMVALNGKSELAQLIEFIVSSSHFSESPELQTEDAVSYINNIINEDGFSLDFIDGTYKISGNVASKPEVIKNTVHFEKIQAQIISELDKARFVIWVAVAWFTDPILFNKLVEKRQQGVNVQVVFVDDEINFKGALPFQGNLPHKLLPKTGYFQNIKHHKFCVIDLERVINGSYNWTIKAQYNDENITISQDRELAKSFAQRFIDLKVGKV